MFAFHPGTGPLDSRAQSSGSSCSAATERLLVLEELFMVEQEIPEEEGETHSDCVLCDISSVELPMSILTLHYRGHP